MRDHLPLCHSLKKLHPRLRANVLLIMIIPPLETLGTILVILPGDRAQGVLYEGGGLTPRGDGQAASDSPGGSKSLVNIEVRI